MGSVLYALRLTALPSGGMLLLAFLAFLISPPPVLVAALQHLAAGIVLSAVAVELVPVISNAPSNLANNTAICVGFTMGVALFVSVGQLCRDDDEAKDGGRGGAAAAAAAVEDGDEAEDDAPRRRTASRSKLGMMREHVGTAANPLRRHDEIAPSDYAAVAAPAVARPRYPTTMVLAVLVDSLCDGFLIGLSAASGTNAGLIMAIALTIEMGFLSLTFTATLRRQPFATALVSVLLPPAALVFGGALGAGTAETVAANAALHVGLISFGVAALLYLVTEELLLEAHEGQGAEGHIAWVDCCFFGGFLASFLLDKLL